MKEKFKKNIEKYDAIYKRDPKRVTRYGLMVEDLYNLVNMPNHYDMVDQLFKLAFVQGMKYQKATSERG